MKDMFKVLCPPRSNIPVLFYFLPLKGGGLRWG
jgi:hypothetical protein